MEDEHILEVINRIVGEIRPSGDSNIDEVRVKRLDTYLFILNEMYLMTQEIINDNQHAHQHSIKKMVEMCEAQIDNIQDESMQI